MGAAKQNVKVVVLGDIGRSPRMQYHCLSLSEMGHVVDIIGYGETDPMNSVKLDPMIYYHYMFPVPQIPIKLFHYIFKTIFQALNLLFLLFVTNKAHVLIMQNPPAIPSIIVCWFYARVVGAKFVIDWHNYAYTIMGLTVGESNPLVWITKQVEFIIGRRADSNLCVSNAMKKDLKIKRGIEASILYDRAPTAFKSLTLEEKHKFLLKFGNKYNSIFLSENERSDTAFTEVNNEEVKLKFSRPGLLVSSTSWTEDEDFSILLEALQEYENHLEKNNIRQLPKLICVITGKGPLKSFYLDKIFKLHWRHVTIITPWLDAVDYPFLLACADLGVSLHTSSSGLDLPMKVVDMFGCGLPVCAYNYECLKELVRHEENSYVFSSSSELSSQILRWFESFPNNTEHEELEMAFKKQLRVFQECRWRENWKVAAAPIFR